jgi:RimJ/RimL family protein N-acetyltransferase
MLQVTSEARGLVRGVFEELDEHLGVAAVLEGQVPGEVFADNLEEPRVAVAWRKQRCYVAGRAESEAARAGLRGLMEETILPAARASGLPLVMGFATRTGWQTGLGEALAEVLPEVGERQYYEHRGPRAGVASPLPRGMALRDVDRGLLRETSLAHLDDVKAEMCSERESAEAFLASSFGVCLVRSDEIVGWCLSEYNRPGRCEVGIEVCEPYQRQGIGTLLAGALVERALADGIRRIGWHCWSRNIASGATARAAGFELVRDYEVRLWWPAQREAA